MTFEILSQILTSPFFILTVLFAGFGYLMADLHKNGFFIGGVVGLIVALISSIVPLEYFIAVFLLLVVIIGIKKRR